MPNYCDYEMKVVGTKKQIQNVIDTLKADYDYNEGKPTHKHLFRVFDVNEGEFEKEDNGLYSMYIFGYCAWSIYSCMCKGEHTYYNDVKKDFPNIFMGTTLQELSKGCKIEVFSEEEGMEFSEHYIFDDGDCLLDDCVDVQQAGYNDKGEITTNIDWEHYDGDMVCLNPHREDNKDVYRWEI